MIKPYYYLFCKILLGLKKISPSDTTNDFGAVCYMSAHFMLILLSLGSIYQIISGESSTMWINRDIVIPLLIIIGILHYYIFLYNKRYMRYFRELKKSPEISKKWTLYTIIYLVATIGIFLVLTYVRIIIEDENFVPK